MFAPNQNIYHNIIKINLLIYDFQFYKMLGQQNTIAITTNSGAKPKQGSIGFFILQSHNGEQYFWSYVNQQTLTPNHFCLKYAPS